MTPNTSRNLIPPDLVALDQRLAVSLTPTEMPSGLADRVFAASRLHLPAAIAGRVGAGSVGGMTVISSRVRWARVAMAVAAGLAIASATFVAMRAPTTSTDRLARRLPAAADRIGPATAPEATLVALLEDREADQWVDDDSFNHSPFAQEVAPVLRARNADGDDVRSELKSILGSG